MQVVEGREEQWSQSVFEGNIGKNFIQMLKDTIFMLAKTLINLRQKKTRFVVLFQQMMR